MSCCFLTNIQSQKTSGDIAAMCCFLMFYCNLQITQYENVGLQDEIQARYQQIERCEDTITHLRERYVDHARDPGKGNIFIIAQKYTSSATNKYHDLPYYVSKATTYEEYNIKMSSLTLS